MKTRAKDDAGLTLVELVVTMAVGSIVLAAVGVVFVGVMRTVSTVNTTTNVTADARIGMESLTRGLRTAVKPKGENSAVLVAKPDEVQVYSSLNRPGDPTTDPIPTKVSFSWSSTTKCLNQTTVKGAANTGSDNATRPFVWTATPETKCVLRTSSSPSFEYFTTGVIATGSPATAVPPLATPTSGLTLADRNTVVSIGMRLTVDDPSTTSDHPVPVTDRVTLPNVIADNAVGASQ
jgi:prepilin-type N-terminal cleavage/methylation domain-containing protein